MTVERPGGEVAAGVGARVVQDNNAIAIGRYEHREVEAVVLDERPGARPAAVNGYELDKRQGPVLATR